MEASVAENHFGKWELEREDVEFLFPSNIRTVRPVLGPTMLRTSDEVPADCLVTEY